VARCLLHGPELLVLDEPADGLDPLGRADLRRILLEVRSRGVTVVVSSHILRELDDLCDSVAILQQGRLVAGGDVNTVASSHDLAHARYRLRVGSDPEAAVAVLARHPVLVEPAATVDGRPSIAFQLRAAEDRVGAIVADLTAQGVVVLELARERTRLEDIYARLSDHHVN
jgi:ABC-2 type transport system ATP-binding protein